MFMRMLTCVRIYLLLLRLVYLVFLPHAIQINDYISVTNTSI
jgi:hypothetical protein